MRWIAKKVLFAIMMVVFAKIATAISKKLIAAYQQRQQRQPSVEEEDGVFLVTLADGEEVFVFEHDFVYTRA